MIKTGSKSSACVHFMCVSFKRKKKRGSKCTLKIQKILFQTKSIYYGSCFFQIDHTNQIDKFKLYAKK